MSRRVAAALSLALAGCAASPPPPPPCGVTPDGVLNEAAWSQAQLISLREGAELRLVQGRAHVCFAAVSGDTPRFADIYVSDATGATLNLRAAAQVGERAVSGGRWSDEAPSTAWGQTTGWRANPPAQGAAFNGYEFVIERARFPRPWRIRVELHEIERPSRMVAWPAESRRNDKRTWALLP